MAHAPFLSTAARRWVATLLRVNPSGRPQPTPSPINDEAAAIWAVVLQARPELMHWCPRPLRTRSVCFKAIARSSAALEGIPQPLQLDPMVLQAAITADDVSRHLAVSRAYINTNTTTRCFVIFVAVFPTGAVHCMGTCNKSYRKAFQTALHYGAPSQSSVPKIHVIQPDPKTSVLSPLTLEELTFLQGTQTRELNQVASAWCGRRLSGSIVFIPSEVWIHAKQAGMD